jgi:hypothetical protein
MKKILLFVFASILVNFVFANEVTFDCKEEGSGKLNPLTLVLNLGAASFNGMDLERDITYLSGKNGKQNYRYIRDNLDMLVPKLMAQNKINQGVVVLYFTHEKIRFSCIK